MPIFYAVVTPKYTLPCISLHVGCSGKLQGNKKENKVQKRKHLLTFFLCLIQFLSFSIHDWTALVETGKHKLWIGLVLDPEHGWQWSDAQPFRYLRWSTGRSSSHCGNFPLFQYLFCCRDAQIFLFLSFCFFLSMLLLIKHTCLPPNYFHFQFLLTFKTFPSWD